MTWLRRIKDWNHDQRGLGVIESLVAIAILGIAVVSLIIALSTGTVAVGKCNQEVVAQSLARTQLEYTKSYPYNSEATTYPYVYTYDETYNPSPITLPEGYTISVEVSSIPEPPTDANIQNITVAISRDGEDILTIEDYKVNR